MRPTSYFSVVRYVADPVRNEPRNIGVIVISPQHRYAKGRFALARTGLASTSPKFDFLRSIVSSWDLNIANQLDWLAPLKKSLDLERLRELHTTSTNVLQFTDPLPVAGDPDAALDATYRDFVMPKCGGGGGSGERPHHLG